MKQNYQVNEYIVDFTDIYQITSISFDNDNKEERRIHYKPIKTNSQSLTASIPENNLTKGGFRKLLTSNQINQILSDFKNLPPDYKYDIRRLKEEIYLNTPEKMAPHLKYLLDEENKITKEEQDLREKIMDHLCIEFSFVTKKSVQDIKKEIKKILSK